MNGHDLRLLLLYFCNKWCKGESNLVFNGSEHDPDNWEYSLGWHIWNKWIDFCNNYHGSLCCIAPFLLDIDESNLTLLINRAKEVYK